MANSIKQNEITDNTTAVNPIEDYIYKHYSDRKQSQDSKWVDYYRTELVAKGITDIDSQIVAKILEVNDGKSIDEVIKDIDDDNKEAYSKLIKVGLRTAWAKECIEEGLKAMAEDREPNYPAFPEVQ